MEQTISLVQRLAERRPLQRLKPVGGVWSAELDDAIAQARAAVGRSGTAKGKRGDEALAFWAGLHLWNDSLDVSHAISQHIETPTGSLWHGIMHRMEGDYGNAKYWFARAGDHPLYADLHRIAVGLLKSSAETALPGGAVRSRDELTALAEARAWDPRRFVDAVERQVTRERDPQAVSLLERLQWHETALLLAYGYREATGGNELPVPGLSANG
ncbi:hypothetical protein ACFFNY_26815 [Paenibacillus hodogayensis]|uniref:Uncharacterized protein n=1 Tax=Paenibacillus hodogayensis TaxID=279208 RepID=A0ABV5W436_9BACL